MSNIGRKRGAEENGMVHGKAGDDLGNTSCTSPSSDDMATASFPTTKRDKPSPPDGHDSNGGGIASLNGPSRCTFAPNAASFPTGAVS